MGGGNNLFTFKWKFENWQAKRGGVLYSPIFTIEKFLNTKWSLQLCKSHRMEVSCGLKRHKSLEGPDKVKINFNIILCCNPDGLTHFENEQTEVFEKDSSYKLYKKLSWREEIWYRTCEIIYIICLMSVDMGEIKRHILNDENELIPSFLNLHLATPNQSKSVLEHFEGNLQELQQKYLHFPNSCFARTVVPIEKKKFIWSMEYFMNNYKEEYVFSAQKGICLSANSRFPDFLMRLHINEENTIYMKILRKGSEEVHGIHGALWISDSYKNICYTEEYLVDDNCDLDFILNTKTWLLKNPGLNLKTFCLYLEIMIQKGDCLSYIESTSPASFHKMNLPDTNEVSDSLQIKMINMYKSKLFCDVILQLPQKKFDAHKAVLCNNSPVFRAMFENKMQENEENVVVIDDIEEDTMDRMLYFMYSDTMTDIGFGDTLKLYEAADKYEILVLRKKCALNLKSNISVENALTLFSLSDSHVDKELKYLVVEFIVMHIREIMMLEDWKNFSKRNVLMANEILEKACMKLTSFIKF